MFFAWAGEKSRDYEGLVEAKIIATQVRVT